MNINWISKKDNVQLQKMGQKMDNILTEIKSVIETYSNSYEKIVPIASELPPEFGAAKTALQLTFDELFNRASLLPSLVSDIINAPSDKFELAPISYVASFRDHMNNTAALLENIFTQLQNLSRWGGLSRVDPTSGVIIAANNQQIDLSRSMEQLSASIDRVLEHRALLASLIKPKGTGTFVAAARALEKSSRKSQELLDKIAEQSSTITEEIMRIEASHSNISTLATQADEMAQKIDAHDKNSEMNEAKIVEKLASVEELTEKSNALSIAVRDYQAEFDELDSSLAKRKNEIDQGRKSLNELTEELIASKLGIEKIIGQANQMLGGATIAGLSGAYKTQTGKLDQEIYNAQLSFFVGIAAFIFIATWSVGLIPGIAGLPPLPPFTADTPLANVFIQIFAALGTRVLVVLPTILIIGFSARRYTSLFRLKEEYSHKYNTAASVHGFKQQAPDYEQQIVAMVFEQLISNPAEALDSKDENVDVSSEPKGMFARLLRPHIEQALDELADLKNTK